MCTSPVQIYRPNRITNGVRMDIVPCGQCSECRSFKRAEVATKSVVESSRRPNLWLLTFTFNQNSVPLSFTPRIVSNDGELLFEDKPFIPDHIDNRESLVSEMVENYRSSSSFRRRFPNSLGFTSFKVCDLSDDVFLEYRVTPSLDRRLFRLWLKRFRVDYKRKNGEPLSEFKYQIFGEYGDLTARPHFHALISGLTHHEMGCLVQSWKKQFGNLDYRFVRKINPDGSPGFVKSAKYISKYIGKDKFCLSHDLEGYVEKPRKMSSIGFGSLSSEEIQKYRNYIFAFDYFKYDPYHPVIPKDVFPLLMKEINHRKRSILFDGEKLCMPQSFIRQIFYDSYIYHYSTFIDESGKECHLPSERVYRPLPIYILSRAFSRSEHNQIFDEQFRLYFQFKDKILYQDVVDFLSLQTSVFSRRESLSSSYYLNSLISEKYV